MDKLNLIACIRAFRQQVISELDQLEDALVSLGDSLDGQSVQEALPEGWLTVRQVCEYLNISQTTFYEGVRRGVFPKGFAFGPKTIRWQMSDIKAWQEANQAHNELGKPAKRRGRPSRVRKIKEFCYV